MSARATLRKNAGMPSHGAQVKPDSASGATTQALSAPGPSAHPPPPFTHSVPAVLAASLSEAPTGLSAA